MYIVQCVCSFLSLLQICKIHISHKKYIWKLKHCNNCLANKTFLAEKFKKLLPSEFGKVFSQLTWFKTFKLHLLHWKPLTTANIFKKKNYGPSKTSFLRLSIGHLHAYFSPACQGPGTGGCMWTLVTLLLLPLLCLLVTLPLLLLLSLSTVLLVSPCHPSLSSATPWLLNFRLKQLLSPSSSPSSPQFFNLPGILSYSLISVFFQKNLSSDSLPSNIRPSWPSSPSKMVGSRGHEVPGLIHLKFKIIIIPELFQGIIGRLLNTSSYNHCTGNPPHALSFCPESHKCRCEFWLKNKKCPCGKSFGNTLRLHSCLFSSNTSSSET